MAFKKHVTRKDVAKRAGVSVAVVSYVVNDGPRPVSAETRAKVKKAIKELGYYPNELARSLSRKQSATIGLIIPSLTNPVYAEIAESLEQVCRAEGYLVMLGATGRDPDKEKRLVETLRAKQVDGVIIIPSELPQEIIAPLQQAGIPVVVLEHDLPDTHCIAIDDRTGGWLAAKHLISLGHKRISMIRRPPSSALSRLRFEGFKAAMFEADLTADPDLIIESKAGPAGGYNSMQQLLALPYPPTAVLTHNDMLAMGAIRAIKDAGLLVPDDISVVGYDDTISVSYLTPPLTSVKFPVAEMGRLAGQIILKLAKEETGRTAQTITLPVELVVRGSTAPPREN